MEFSGDFLTNWAERLDRSDEFIEDLQHYISKLTDLDLPVIFSPLHWAKLMGTNYSTLNLLLDNRESYYTHFRIRKKKGKGYRYISAPNGSLLEIQQWIKVNILDKLVFGEHLTSYQKGKSIVNNAKIHVGQQIVVKFDLQNFFESITQDRVFGIFKLLGYNAAVAVDLAKACCINLPQRQGKLYKNGKNACLPQGSPASPTLSNLGAAMLDLRLLEYARSRSLNFSRYADDITFSGDIQNKPFSTTIGYITASEGFILNLKKTKYVQAGAQQLVTGLNVNTKLSIPKKKRREIHTHLHNCLKFGPFAHMERTENFILYYREWLLGNIIYIQMVHKEEGHKLRERFDRISWL